MRVCLLSGLLLSVACVGAKQEADGRVPGELVGVFAATGRITTDDCGAELLGAENPWTFPVKLSRRENVLYWLNGSEAIVGDLASDEASFEFSTRIESVLTAARGASPGCTVERRDHLAGKLRGTAEDVSGFAGTLSYEYHAKNSADCLEFIGVPGGVASLPCELGYELVAELLASD